MPVFGTDPKDGQVPRLPSSLRQVRKRVRSATPSGGRRRGTFEAARELGPDAWRIAVATAVPEIAQARGFPQHLTTSHDARPTAAPQDCEFEPCPQVRRL
jgi:hypothetical protein